MENILFVIFASIFIWCRKSFCIYSVLCGDFMFVIVFGQLTLVLFFEKANTYGSVFSFFLALLLRLLCGDEKMNLDRVISFGTIYSTTKMCDGVPCEGEVPFRTIVTIIGIVSQYLHLNNKFSKTCFGNVHVL